MAVESTIIIKAKDGTKRAFTSINKGLGKVRAGINSTHVKVGVLAGVAGFGALIKSSSKTADSLAKTADKIGISTGALAGLQNAAEITSVSQETLNKALVKQQVAISDYGNGIGLAKREFEQMGFAQDELAKMPVDEQFFAIADALGKVKNSTDRVNIAYKIYGGRATDLLNTLDLGREGLQKFREESDLFGTSISRIDAAKIEMANDSWTRVGQITKGFSLQMTTELAPILEGVGNLFVDNAKEAGGFGKVAIGVIDGIMTSAGFVGDVFHGWKVIWGGLKLAFVELAGFIVGNLDSLQQSIVGIINLMPGIDVKPMQSLAEATSALELASIDAQAELLNLTTQPLPSENFKQWSEGVRAHAQTAAEAVAASKEQVGVISLEKTQEHLNEETRLMLFADAMRLQNQRLYNEQVIAAAEEMSRAKQDILGKTFGNLAVLMSSGSKKVFKIGQLAAISSATISGLAASVDAFKAGMSIGGPAAPAFAAAYKTSSLIATGVQIAAIASAKPPGGARELGGDVMPGKTYRINERGEEFFTPKQAGTVTPANQIGGSQITFAPSFGLLDGDLSQQQQKKLFNNMRNMFVDWMHEEGHGFA